MRDVASLQHGETVTVEYPGGFVRVGAFVGKVDRCLVLDSHRDGISRVSLDASDVVATDRMGEVIGGHDPDPPLPLGFPDLE
jgi:hypothetical protein